VRATLKAGWSVVLIALLGGCDDYSSAPQRIKADNRTFFACSGFVRVSETEVNGHSRYEIEFIDASGATKTISGIKKLELVAIPSTVSVPMPSPLPDPINGKDDDGLRFKEGWTYTWPNGASAKLVSGRWVPIKERNPVCDSK
jgi:hypothetical protein